MLSLHGGWLVVFRGKTIACLVCFRTSLTAEKVTLTVTGPRLIVAYVWSCIPEIVALLASLPLERWFVHCLSCRLKYRYQNAGPGVRFANNNNRASLGADFVQRGVHVFVYADANKIQLSQGNRRNLIHPFMYVSAYRHAGCRKLSGKSTLSRNGEGQGEGSIRPGTPCCCATDDQRLHCDVLGFEKDWV